MAAVEGPAFRVEVNDPLEPGWEPWHGFPGRRWVEGWPSLRDAIRAGRCVASHRQRWHVRVVNRANEAVSRIA